MYACLSSFMNTALLESELFDSLSDDRAGEQQSGVHGHADSAHKARQTLLCLIEDGYAHTVV